MTALPAPTARPPGLREAPKVLRYGKDFREDRERRKEGAR